MNRIVIINHSYFEDDHVDCDIEDSCDEDDYENMKLQKMVEEVQFTNMFITYVDLKSVVFKIYKISIIHELIYTYFIYIYIYIYIYI